ncbi:unnamed protein product, partial [Iphiclides podalirius]
MDRALLVGILSIGVSARLSGAQVVPSVSVTARDCPPYCVYLNRELSCNSRVRGHPSVFALGTQRRAKQTPGHRIRRVFPTSAARLRKKRLRSSCTAAESPATHSRRCRPHSQPTGCKLSP